MRAFLRNVQITFGQPASINRNQPPLLYYPILQNDINTNVKKNIQKSFSHIYQHPTNMKTKRKHDILTNDLFNHLALFSLSHRSTNVTRTSYEIHGLMINMDFLITPTYQHPTAGPSRTNFSNGTAGIRLSHPQKLVYAKNLENHGLFVY